MTKKANEGQPCNLKEDKNREKQAMKPPKTKTLVFL